MKIHRIKVKLKDKIKIITIFMIQIMNFNIAIFSKKKIVNKIVNITIF